MPDGPTTRLLIVGGSDAGIAAALRAREVDPTAEVTVVVADAYPNYSICGLPFFLSGETPDWRDLAHRTRADIEAAGVRLLLDHRADSIDPDRRAITVTAPDGRALTMGYDRLIIGTGATPVRPPIAGIDLPGVHVLHTMDDSFAVHELLTRQPRSAVIIGAGYIGTEMADALTHRGLDVTLVEQLPSALTTVDAPLGDDVAAELRRHDVTVATGVPIEAIAPEGGRLLVRGTGGFSATADLVLVAVGVRPDTALAETAGVQLGVRGAVRVDRRMRTTVDGVYAAGDCAETWHRLLQRPAYLPLGTTAHKQGRVAGENAAGGDRTFAGTLGTQVVKIFDLAVARTGFRDQEARDAGYDPLTVETAADDHKAYYPGATRMRLRVTGDRRDGRLLGAQILGSARAQVAKRIDVYAAAIAARLTVDEVTDLDLSYTPPFSAPWDPVQAAATAWTRQLATAGRTA
jgi:NADPH-dependent 2,4-dienoyl-CoA reductase/sulfur reductase-like enzyme